MLRAAYGQPDILRQHLSSRAKLFAVKIQHAFSGWQGRLFSKPDKYGFLGLREFTHLLRFLFIPALHCFYRMHFLFQKLCAVRVLPGNDILLVFYLLLNPAEPFLFFLIFAALPAGHLFLARKCLLPVSDICLVACGSNCMARLCFTLKLLKMDNFICCLSKQHFIMRNKQNRQRCPADKIPEPLQRLDIDIVRRLIQAQDVRALHQNPGQLEFYLFPA